ncbi:hypothetical protein SAMN05216516_11548 [Izhakiella capsodis]|uniref:Uncharacterized protein n=1 Tax=Izhakiella capsodis TaxID=1367852 RepID=A0A1I5BAV4_9GAMM|nr:hypothetical protein [Izhakiella capsodis]SFN71659.1 hypothetical protein SAMN05216516_11548 [Izhakiella capsodis]
MPDSIRKYSSCDSAPLYPVSRYDANDDPAQESSDPSLRSVLRSVDNSMQTLSVVESDTNTRTGGIFSRVSSWLPTSFRGYMGGDARDDKQPAPTEVYATGEVLRRKAEARQEEIALRHTFVSPPVPYEWKGALPKRALIGVSTMSALGGTVYKYSTIRNTPTGAMADSPPPPSAQPDLVKLDDYGAGLERLPEHYVSYDDHPANGIRHRRHNLSASPYDKKAHEQGNFKSHLHRANQYVNTLFYHDGLLENDTTPDREKMLFLASDYLFQGERGSIEQDYRVKSLAQAILSGRGLYGGGKDEDITSEQASNVIRHWVFENILRNSPEKYIESKIKEDESKVYTIEDITRMLPVDKLPDTRSFHPGRLTVAERTELSEIWKKLMMEEMPFLALSDDRVKTMPLNGYEFANLYAGARFLKETTGKKFTFDEAMLTGEKMCALAAEEGISEREMRLYLPPALYYLATKSHEVNENANDFDIVNRYLQYHHDVSEIKKDFEKKYKIYLSATNAWMSKGKLADKIISECHPLTQNAPRRIKKRSERLDFFQINSPREDYLNGIDKPCRNAPNSLGNEYIRLTAYVADSFLEVDRDIIQAAISKFSENEKQFIESADEIHPANAYIQMHQLSDRFVPPKYYLQGADLFAVKLNGEERIYILIAEKDQSGSYKLIRVDRNIIPYLTNGLFGDPLNLSKIDWGDENAIFERFHFEVEIDDAAWIGRGEHNTIITDEISKIHRDKLYNALYEAGNDKSKIQTVWSITKHLIPFHDCVEGVIAKKTEEAVPACLLDVVAFIPVFGQAAKLSVKFSRGLTLGLRSGVSIASKDGIQAATRGLVREIRLPTTSELASLGKNTLRSADPGFELIGDISKKLGHRVIKVLSGDSKTAALAEKMASSGHLRSLPDMPENEIQMLKLPHSELIVPTVKIREIDGEPIYVRVDPETGEGFGQYYLLNNGKLRPLPHDSIYLDELQQFNLSCWYNRIKRSLDNIAKTQFCLNDSWKVTNEVTLREIKRLSEGNTGIYKKIYTLNTNSQSEYFIKQDGVYHKVKYDGRRSFWRMENIICRGCHAIPIKLNQKGRWEARKEVSWPKGLPWHTPGSVIRKVKEEYILEKHMSALEQASVTKNFAVSFRKAGKPTLIALNEGAAAKPHSILEKTIKESSLIKYYPENKDEVMRKIREAGIEGIVGHWSKDNGLEGIYLTNNIQFINTIRISDEVFIYPIDIEKLEESLRPLKEKEGWKKICYTGDYDTHEIIKFSNAGRPRTALDGNEEKEFINILNNAVSLTDNARTIDSATHRVFQHGAQVNYPTYMINNKFEGEGGLNMAVANPGEFPIMMLDRGIWSIINNSDELNKYYRNIGAIIKESWRRGGDVVLTNEGIKSRFSNS